MKLKVISVLICVLLLFCSCKDAGATSSEISSKVNSLPLSSLISNSSQVNSKENSNTNTSSEQQQNNSNIALDTKPYTV